MPNDPITAGPRKDYFFHAPHANIDGHRSLDTITTVVCHRTVSDDGTAEPIARMFRDSSSAGSTTYTLDSYQTQQSMRLTAVCQGAASNGNGANVWGVHIEFCSQPWWKKVFYLRKHLRMLRRGAYRTAKLCHRFDLPVRWVSAGDLRAGGKRRRGITDHATISKAWVPGGHTDKAPPRRYFLRQVRKALRKIERQGRGRERERAH